MIIGGGLLGPEEIIFRGAIDILDLLNVSGQYVYGRKGIITGQLGSTVGADTNDPTPTAYGLSFGGDDYVLCGRPAAMEVAQPFCIYGVFYINPSGNFECFVSKNNTGSTGASSKGFMLLKGTTNLVQIQAFDGSGTLTPVYSAGAVSAGWHYLFAGWDGANLNIKVDRLATRQAAMASYSADNATQLNLGKYAYAASVWFTGQESIVVPCAVYHSAAEEEQNYKYLKNLMAERGISI